MACDSQGKVVPSKLNNYGYIDFSFPFRSILARTTYNFFSKVPKKLLNQQYIGKALNFEQ